MVPGAREQIERRHRPRFMNQRDLREREADHRNHRDGCWAATRPGARAPMSRLVVGRRRVVRLLMIVPARGGGRGTLMPGRVTHPAMHRAPHDRLGPTHEEWQPEAQYERQDPTGQRTTHREVWRWTDKLRVNRVRPVYAKFVRRGMSNSTHCRQTLSKTANPGPRGREARHRYTAGAPKPQSWFTPPRRWRRSAPATSRSRSICPANPVPNSTS